MKLYREAVKTGDKTKIDNAKGYLKFATSRRNSNYITATLKQMTPYIDRDTDCFDRDPFLLSTPDGVYDLRKGPINPKPHDPEDYMTKILHALLLMREESYGKMLWIRYSQVIKNSSNMFNNAVD